MVSRDRDVIRDCNAPVGKWWMWEERLIRQD